MTVRLYLVLSDREILIGPRDEATLDWLESGSGRMYCWRPLTDIAHRWMSRGISRNDLPVIAAELQELINARYRYHAEGHHLSHPPIVIEVRACESRPIFVGEELCEI
jgi:hypothetical protein